MTSLRLDTCNVPSLLALHSAVIDELQTRKVLRSRNNPTGDYAEWLAAKKLGLTLVTNSLKGYDATDERGQRYQIKGRRAAIQNKAPLLSTIRNYEAGDFDFLLAVVFEPDWSVRCAAKIAHADLEAFLKYRKHVNGHNMRFGVTTLGDHRVQNLTETLRANS